ncbi:hypothetical protein [Collimonas sp.]|jgi:hypothetical protein|uniref:hypothetical protein n=1 Tax=Collimonas sp. TaxID=1963772 RepID=UPI002CF07EE0|nr:hypothetical protein [Collimonas sp.]HWX00385.1 hypothetical protein [Collimonas sp.]
MKDVLQARASEPVRARSHAATAVSVKQDAAFVDNHPLGVAQRKLAESMAHSPRAVLQNAISNDIHQGPRMQAQRQQMRGISAVGAPAVQRAEAAGRDLSAQGNAATLRRAAMSGRLSSEQINMRPAQQALSAADLTQLAAATKSMVNPASQPIADALAAGSAAVAGDVIAMRSPAIGDGSAQAVARGVSALRPKAAAVEVAGNQYRVMARLNPWIQVAGGVITSMNTTNHHMTPPAGAGWQFVTYPNLTAGGVDISNRSVIVGQPWGSGGGGGGVSSFTVPSATFDPTSVPSSFHSLPHDRLPSLPSGHAWTGGGSTATPYVPMRDPLVAPSSPGYDVDAEDIGGRLVYSSYQRDPTPINPGGTRVLSGYAEVAQSGHTYSGSRSYPMTTNSFADPGGARYGRGHVVDHADGSHATTTSLQNYVPEDPDFNSGARNHMVQSIRPSGGYYQARYDYPSAPTYTIGGAPIPSVEHFQTVPSGGTREYAAVDNQNYPADRHRIAVNPYLQPPTTSFPQPQWF